MSQNEQAIKALTTKLRWLLNEIGILPEASSSRTLQLQHNMILYLLALSVIETSPMRYLGSWCILPMSWRSYGPCAK